MKKISCLIILFIMVLSVASLHGAQLKVSIPEFKVTGAANRDELKSTLQALLASRLASGSLLVAEAGETADFTVDGTYIAFGKVFSLDARVTNRSGKVLGRAFEQGESADDIIPAVNRLAQKLGAEITKVTSPAPGVVTAAPAPAASVAATPEIIRPMVVKPQAPEGDIIKPEAAVTRAAESGTINQRLGGVLIAIAPGKRTATGERELIAALNGELRVYRQGKDLKLLQSLQDFAANDKIVAVDSADLDGDGIPEVYVTNFHGEDLASRVYLLENGSLRKIAADVPYFFRAIGFNGGAKKVYAQAMGRDVDFYGGLFEVVKKGDKFTFEHELKLPRFANIYNLNQVTDRDGKQLFIILHPDNYLLVYDKNGELLWKSNEKFGGSETYFLRDDIQNERTTGSKVRRVFLEQRITVTREGAIIIPKSEGYFVVGDSRSFNRNSIYAFSWNGVALDELWHTKLSHNYLSDYFYDNDNKELVLLEVIKKEGITEKGASAISIKRVE